MASVKNNIIWVIQSRMRLAGHVACMEGCRSAYMILVVRPEGKTSLERPRLDGRIILKRTLKKRDRGKQGLHLFGSG